MSISVQRRRGTTEEHENFAGALGEVTVDTDKNTLVVHDGETEGGFPQDNARKILGRIIDIEDFDGLDGYILAYDETEDKFYLKKDEGGGGGDGLEFVYGLRLQDYFPDIQITDIELE